jgi:hypothetical protein
MQMDLAVLISQSAGRIKKNLILFVPPILTQVVVPLALLTVAAFTLFPLLVALSLTGDTWGLIQTIAGGAVVLAAAGFLVDAFVTAGWVYMNRRVVTDGQTGLADLWVGAKKYFLRILGGRILIGVIVVVPVAAGIAAIAASILTLNVGQPTPPPGELTPATIVGLLAPIILGMFGILVIVGLIELVLYIFLLPWMQALVMDDLGIWGSIKSSFTFVRRNFATMIGYVVISAIPWIAASWMASLLWPSFSYSELTRPSVYMNSTRLLGLLLGASNVASSLISALLSAFFTLLLFMIYADRTRGAPTSRSAESFTAAPAPQVPQPEPSPPQRAPRGMKYCLNCGAMVISLAVFCPNCGARQPPLAPE